MVLQEKKLNKMVQLQLSIEWSFCTFHHAIFSIIENVSILQKQQYNWHEVLGKKIQNSFWK